MRGSSTLLAFLSLLAAAAGQGPHYKISQVQDNVDSMLAQFKQYATFQGADNAPADIDPHAEPATAPTAPVDSLAKRQSSCGSFWLESMTHQGKASFNTNSAYVVFRNVKSYGAKGDGSTDDTAAINRAMSDGSRCGPGKCASSTTTPAVLYFPAGTYVLSSSIVMYDNTMIIGNPNCVPTLKATSGFSGFGLIDGNQYQNGGALGFGATNVFYRQIRNLVIDMRSIPASSSATGIHWPVAQSTSLQNIVFRMADAAGTQHQGVFIESGSGGFANDLVFYGGLNGAVFGNQQFTMRNLTFYNCQTAISQIWSWGWTYKSLSINNCSVGVMMNGGGRTAQTVGSVTILDSSVTNTATFVITAHDSSSSPATAGSLALENVAVSNVPTFVANANGVVYKGTTGKSTIAAWGEGHMYSPQVKNLNFMSGMLAFPRASSLVTTGSKFYERSKPQYEALATSSFISARSYGAKGDGTTDDTTALQNAATYAAANNRVLFVDEGVYKVTKTLYLPKGLRVTGEFFPVIMSSGSFFANMASPQPVVQVGKAGEAGVVEWSNMVVATQGAQAGATLIEWNLASPATTPSGMWDVHTRIGGFKGSNLQIAQCPTTASTTATASNINTACIGAFMSMHVTSTAAGLYAENVWLWTADHDIDDSSLRQITVYTGRGLLVESAAGPLWLVGTAVEHHSKYQYQFANTANVFMGQIQTETAYYQPNPDASAVFPTVAALNDPVFATTNAANGDNRDGYGLRVLNSTGIVCYGAGLYSFFNNYSTTCSNAPGGACQTRIMSVEGKSTVYVYNLNTVGATSMITKDGVEVANYKDNLNVYPDTVAVYRSS